MAVSGPVPVELGDKRIKDLLMQYAVPAIIAMTASSLYNMVDSIYIGHIKDVGSIAISGLAVTFPLMNLATALGTLVGLGASTILSVVLGQKNYEVAGKVLVNELLLNIILGVAFSVVTIAFLDPILMFFGASDKTLPFARDYMLVILLGNVITHMYFGLNNMLRTSGNPKLAMYLTIFTVVSNAILDPVFIFVLDMGIQGAAIATVLCQLLSLIYSVMYFCNQERFLHFPAKLREYTLDWRIAKDSLSIGMGPFLMNSAACIVTLFINQQLAKYGGDLAIGAYGIVNRISFVFIMVNMGFNQGMQPIAGYNFGARRYSRVKKVYWLTVCCTTIVTMCGFILAQFFPEIAVALFTSDPQLTELSEKGLKIVLMAFPLVGFQMATTNLFQCLGMVSKSVFMSLSRQLLFLIPLLYFLPLEFGHEGVWMSFPIADSISIIVAGLLAMNLFKKLKNLHDGDDPTGLGSMISA
mgnify:CR=1 FL=1